MKAAETEPVDQRDRELLVEREPVLALGYWVSLAQAAADRVGADHAITLRELRGHVVHVAPGARQAVQAITVSAPKPCSAPHSL